jgi:hypothetical protein
MLVLEEKLDMLGDCIQSATTESLVGILKKNRDLTADNFELTLLN